MIKYKACPRCGGDVIREPQINDNDELVYLQCGRRASYIRIAVPRQPSEVPFDSGR
jgi:hypothetical protein